MTVESCAQDVEHDRRDETFAHRKTIRPTRSPIQSGVKPPQSKSWRYARISHVVRSLRFDRREAARDDNGLMHFVLLMNFCNVP